jgi:type I restriction enzyme S subunit
MKAKTKTTATKEEATPALVPKLRFPEFREALGWEPKRLGLALKFQAGFPFPSSGFNDARKGLRLIRNRDLRSDDIVKFYSEDFDPNFVVTNGDVLVGMDGDFTPTVWEKGEALLNQRVGRILPRGDNDHRFLLYLLTLCLKGIEEATARTTVKHLSHSAVEDKHEPLPSPAEQQKIAECLSSVDELIAAQARKLDALKTHKKGLMQQLFPREGETQPRLRFPEFQNAGEWASEPLGDLGEIVTGKTPSTKEADLWGGDILFITPTDISEEDKYQYTTARTVIETKSTKILPPGSVVYTCIASIGKMALTVHPSITNQQINAVVPNEKALGEFIYYALLNLTPWIKTLPATNTLPIINKTDFSKIAILFPEDKAEQQRITDCLTSLDALIAAQTQKHEALKTHKKGLMQQLFPSPEDSQ